MVKMTRWQPENRSRASPTVSLSPTHLHGYTVCAGSICGVAHEVGSKKMSTLDHDGVSVVKPGQTYVGKQGFTYCPSSGFSGRLSI